MAEDQGAIQRLRAVSARVLGAGGGRISRAWLVMVTAVAVHVADEAVTGFLPFYNDLVGGLRERMGFFPAPTFTFRAWLGGLALAVAAGYALTPLVARGGPLIRVTATALGILMAANALGHLAGSLYFGRLLPGFWSSPLLLVCALRVVRCGAAGDWGRTGS